MADLRLVAAPPGAQEGLRALLLAYSVALGHVGEGTLIRLPLYWTDPKRWPFLIRLEKETAGFALVRSLAEGSFEMAEFAILPRFRRCGLGRQAAAMAFARFPGRWRLWATEGARRFWPNAIASAGWRPESTQDGWFHFDVAG